MPDRTPERPALTQRQQEVLSFIATRTEKDGFPPTIREIGDHLGIGSTNGVNDHLKALERKGYLQRSLGKSRGLFVVPSPGGGRRAVRQAQLMSFRDTVLEESIEIPIKGRIAAGEPILAVEQKDDTVRIDRFFLGKDRDVFALRVVGESMIEDGIHDGDFIFVRKQQTAPRGSIVVAMIEGEATVKRFFHEGDRVRFQPSNSAMKPIYVKASEFRETQIVGIVVGIYRTF